MYLLSSVLPMVSSVCHGPGPLNLTVSLLQIMDGNRIWNMMDR